MIVDVLIFLALATAWYVLIYHKAFYKPTSSSRELVKPTSSSRELVKPTSSSRELVKPTSSSRELVKPTSSSREIDKALPKEGQLDRIKNPLRLCAFCFQPFYSNKCPCQGGNPTLEEIKGVVELEMRSLRNCTSSRKSRFR